MTACLVIKMNEGDSFYMRGKALTYENMLKLFMKDLQVKTYGTSFLHLTII